MKWRTILKNVVKNAGANNKNCALLLHESELNINHILQDIDSVLNTGEVPMLYAADEIQDILQVKYLQIYLYFQTIYMKIYNETFFL